GKIMPHFYVAPENIKGGAFVIEGTEAHHLGAVRRCQPGDVIEIFDGTGKTYRGRIDHVEKDLLRGTILHEEEPVKSRIDVRLYQAMPKGERFDWLLEKAAELGVHSVVPLVTARSVIREVSPSKRERWNRLALAACKQCGRSGLMSVEPPVPFAEAVENLPQDAFNIIPWESEETKTVAAAYREKEKTVCANVFIGPEGGFTPQEITLAEKRGIVPVTLGKRILRVETAALLSVILVMNMAGEYNG
ncbi:MAG: RsmE family RNA methyltransferase, partial [Endomicrobiales bacterium]